MSAPVLIRGFAPVANSDVDLALRRFDSEHSNVLGEAALFVRRRLSETAPWHWAFDALIHQRRGQVALARASWRRAMRLSMIGGAA